MEFEGLKIDNTNEKNSHSDCNDLKNYSLEEILQLNEVDKILKQRDVDVSEFESLSKLRICEKEILSNIKDFVTYYFDDIISKNLSYKNIRRKMPQEQLFRAHALNGDSSHERKYAIFALKMLEKHCSQFDVIIHLVYGGLLSLIEEALAKIKHDQRIQNFFLESTNKKNAATQTENIVEVSRLDLQQEKSKDSITQKESFEPLYMDISSQTEIKKNSVNNKGKKKCHLSDHSNETGSSNSSIPISQNKLVTKLHNKPHVNVAQLPLSLYFSKTDSLTKKEITTRSDVRLEFKLNDELHPISSETFPNPFYVSRLTPEIKQSLSEGNVIKNITIPKEEIRAALKNKFIVLPKRKYTKTKKKVCNTENNVFDENRDNLHSTFVQLSDMNSTLSNNLKGSKNYSKEFRKSRNSKNI